MTAQGLLFMAWQKGYSLQSRNGTVRISRADGAAIPEGLITEVRAHKPQLLVLLAKLESFGAVDDGLILEALALFNAEPKGLVKTSSIPFPEPVRPSVALEGQRDTTTARQATFWKNKDERTQSQSLGGS
jgi:hypothetical protein